MLALEMFMNGTIPYISNLNFEDVQKLVGSSEKLSNIEKDLDCNLLLKRIRKTLSNYDFKFYPLLIKYFNPSNEFMPVSELARAANCDYKSLRAEIEKAQRVLRKDRIIRQYLCM